MIALYRLINPLLFYNRQITNVIVAMLLTLAFNGQVAIHADHNGHDESGNIVTIGSRSFYLIRSLPLPSCCRYTDIRIRCVSNSGNFIFEKQIASLTELRASNLAVMDDSTLIIGCSTQFAKCDVASPVTLIFRLDTLGNIISSLSVNSFCRKVVPTPSASFLGLFHSGPVLFKNDMPVDTFPGSFAIDALPIEHGRTLVSYSLSAPKFSVLDSAGTVEKDVLTASPQRDLAKFQDGKLIAADDNHLYLYDNGLSLISTSSSLVPQSYKPRSFAVQGNQIIVAAQYLSDKNSWLSLDSTLKPTYSLVTAVNKSNPTSITVNNGSIQVVSTADAGHYYVSLFSFSLGDVPLLNTDAGVTNMTIVSVSYASTGFLPTAIVNAGVTVKNFGADTIRNVRLQSFSSNLTLGHCLLGLNREFILNLAPGDSIVISTGPFIANVNEWINETTTAQVCINTSVPNKKNDANTANDLYCINGSFTHTAVREIAPAHSAMIYPNPAGGSFRIEHPGEIKSIVVSDQTGRIMFSVTAPGTPVFSTAGLGPGIYIVKILTTTSLHTERLIVE